MQTDHCYFDHGQVWINLCMTKVNSKVNAACRQPSHQRVFIMLWPRHSNAWPHIIFVVNVTRGSCQARRGQLLLLQRCHEGENTGGRAAENQPRLLSEMCATLEWRRCNAHMYSMVPQKVCVTEPSWIDSLQRPKSVSLMCPSETVKRSFRWQYFLHAITNTFQCLKEKLHLSHKSWKNNTWIILNTAAIYNFSQIRFERFDLIYSLLF